MMTREEAIQLLSEVEDSGLYDIVLRRLKGENLRPFIVHLQETYEEIGQELFDACVFYGVIYDKRDVR